jgi:hypothetical protein
MLPALETAIRFLTATPELLNDSNPNKELNGEEWDVNVEQPFL